MNRPRIRPRFRLEAKGNAEDARRRIRAALETDGCAVRGGRVGDRFELRMPDDEQHYWSPHLSVVLRDEADGVVVVEGRFGPQDHVWTMYAALYGFVVFVGIGAVIYGTSQWILGQEPWVLWGAPVSAAVVLLVYLSAFYGQGLGRDQMYELRSFVEQAVAGSAQVSPPRPSSAAGSPPSHA